MLVRRRCLLKITRSLQSSCSNSLPIPSHPALSPLGRLLSGVKPRVSVSWRRKSVRRIRKTLQETPNLPHLARPLQRIYPFTLPRPKIHKVHNLRSMAMPGQTRCPSATQRFQVDKQALCAGLPPSQRVSCRFSAGPCLCRWSGCVSDACRPGTRVGRRPHREMVFLRWRGWSVIAESMPVDGRRRRGRWWPTLADFGLALPASVVSTLVQLSNECTPSGLGHGGSAS